MFVLFQAPVRWVQETSMGIRKLSLMCKMVTGKQFTVILMQEQAQCRDNHVPMLSIVIVISRGRLVSKEKFDFSPYFLPFFPL